jgi:hypothetical protein
MMFSTYLFSPRRHPRGPLAPLLIIPSKPKLAIRSPESIHHCSRGPIPGNLSSTLTLAQHSIEGRTIHISLHGAPGMNPLTLKTAIHSYSQVGELTECHKAAIEQAI